MTDSPAAPDPDLLARWIAVASLLASATEMQGRRGGAWPGLALITADTADEAVLGLIAAAGDDPPAERAGFSEIYKLALAVLDARERPMPESMRGRVLRVHRARNMAVHLAVEPAETLVATAIRTAVELRELAIEALDVLAAFRESGPVRAVAELVGIPAVSGPLGEAERLLAEGKPSEAADQAAAALHAALSRVTPGLRDWGHRRPMLRNTFPGQGMSSDYRNAERALEEAFVAADKRSDRLEAWILAFGLGLRPSELARLQRVVGTPIYTMGGPQPAAVNRHPDVELTPEAVTSAVLLTADVIYRLWQNDSMRAGEPWEA